MTFIETFLSITVTLQIFFVAYLWSELRAMKNSTHSIQMVPVDNKGKLENLTPEQIDTLEKNMGLDNLLGDNI